MLRPFHGFLALSVGLHAVAAGLFAEPLSPGVGINNPAMQIALVPAMAGGAPASLARASETATSRHRLPDPTDTAQAAPRDPHRPPAAKPARQHIPATEKPVELATAPVAAHPPANTAPAGTQEAPMPDTRGPHGSTAGTRHPSPQISAALNRRLAAYFSYPLLARRRGWQGEVLLGLRLESSGLMSNVRVVSTSGHTILDRSALRSAQQASEVPEAANWLAGQSIDMVVPVRYRLTGS